jgi:hypothetical protein
VFGKKYNNYNLIYTKNIEYKNKQTSRENTTETIGNYICGAAKLECTFDYERL